MEKMTNRLKATILASAGLLQALGAYAARVPPMAGAGSAAGAAAGGQDTLSVADLIHRSGRALVADGTVQGLSRDRIAGMQSYCPLDDRHLLSYLADHYRALPAGYRHSYSNPGFELLGYAIEEASGRPFTDHVGARILEPLDLGSTTHDEQAPTALPRAGTYVPAHDDPVEEMPIRYTVGGGLTTMREKPGASAPGGIARAPAGAQGGCHRQRSSID